MPLTGIILAGGRSRRMGVEKGLVHFNGQPLINYSIKVLKDLCSEIMISSNSNCYDYLGYKVVPDLVEDSGPMVGIYSCLTESKNRANLVISCDMPFVTEEIFQHLVSQAGNAWICVPWYENDHFEPLCGLYQKDVLPEMKEFIGDGNYKLPDLFKKTNISVVNVNELLPTLHEHYFMNINTPSDLATAEKLRFGRFI